MALPTYTTRDAEPGRHRVGGAFGLAFAASALVHLAAFAAFAVSGWGTGGAAQAVATTNDPLNVLLVRTREGAGANESAFAATVQSGGIPASTSDGVTAAPANVVARAATAPADDPGPAGGRVPRVIVDDRVPRARFNAAFDGGPLADFPREVEKPAALPGRIHIPYPPEALASRREGTVLAFAIVDARGVVEETTIVEGAADFNAAVKATLAKTRLIPASDRGVAIRYYIALRFDFRIDDRGEVAPTAAAAR